MPPVDAAAPFWAASCGAFVGWFLISFAYRFQVFGDLTALGATALGFTVPDAIIPGIVIWAVVSLLGLSGGTSPVAVAIVTLVLAALVMAAAYFFSSRPAKVVTPAVNPQSPTK